MDRGQPMLRRLRTLKPRISHPMASQRLLLSQQVSTISQALEGQAY